MIWGLILLTLYAVRKFKAEQPQASDEKSEDDFGSVNEQNLKPV